MSFLKDNGGPLVIAGTAIVICGGYFELRLAAELEDAVKAETDGIPVISQDKITAMEKDIADLEKADDKMDDKITRIIDILLEE